MGLFDRLLRPYESVYNSEDCRDYFVRFIDAYRFAESVYPTPLNSVSRRLYAVYYAALFHLIPGRPFKKGEIVMQVMKAMCGASLMAQNAKRAIEPNDVLFGHAQIHGYATELVMRTQVVSPGKAFQMRMFDDCFGFIAERAKRDGAFAACIEKLQSVSKWVEGKDKDAGFYGHRWRDVMSTIGEDHFQNEHWGSQVDDYTRRLFNGEIAFDINAYEKALKH